MAAASGKEKKQFGSHPSGVLEIAADQALVSTKDGEAALDTLGAVLRTLGSASFDVAELDAAEVRRLFERWSEHVLVAAPLDAGTSSGGQRQWSALRQLVASHRKRESSHVTATIGNLREAIWSFVETVNRATSQDKQEGVIARERLAKLRSALEGKDVEIEVVPGFEVVPPLAAPESLDDLLANEPRQTVAPRSVAGGAISSPETRGVNHPAAMTTSPAGPATAPPRSA